MPGPNLGDETHDEWLGASQDPIARHLAQTFGYMMPYDESGLPVFDSYHGTPTREADPTGPLSAFNQAAYEDREPLWDSSDPFDVSNIDPGVYDALQSALAQGDPGLPTGDAYNDAYDYNSATGEVTPSTGEPYVDPLKPTYENPPVENYLPEINITSTNKAAQGALNFLNDPGQRLLETVTPGGYVASNTVPFVEKAFDAAGRLIDPLLQPITDPLKKLVEEKGKTTTTIGGYSDPSQVINPDAIAPGTYNMNVIDEPLSVTFPDTQVREDYGNSPLQEVAVTAGRDPYIAPTPVDPNQIERDYYTAPAGAGSAEAPVSPLEEIAVTAKREEPPISVVPPPAPVVQQEEDYTAPASGPTSPLEEVAVTAKREPLLPTPPPAPVVQQEEDYTAPAGAGSPLEEVAVTASKEKPPAPIYNPLLGADLNPAGGGGVTFNTPPEDDLEEVSVTGKRDNPTLALPPIDTTLPGETVTYNPVNYPAANTTTSTDTSTATADTTAGGTGGDSNTWVPGGASLSGGPWIDWAKLQQEAAAAGMGLSKYTAMNWNKIRTPEVEAAHPMPVKKAAGGPLMALAQGGGSGRDDTIPAQLSDGEYVIDAETVALLGDGSVNEGARKLDELREAIRQHKGRQLAKGKISPNAKSPLEYLKGVK